MNACGRSGAWQNYDVVFTAPDFVAGKLAQFAGVTVFHHGVLVHLNEEIRDETGHRILPEYKPKIGKGPLRLSGHGCPVRSATSGCNHFDAVNSSAPGRRFDLELRLRRAR